jgi:hypothetical protein
MSQADPQPTAPVSKLRWYRITPDRVVIALLAVEVLLWLSYRFAWLPWHKGYAVLSALGVVVAALVGMLLWFIVALIFRWRFQFSIWLLMMLTVVVAIPFSWVAVEIRAAKRQEEAVATIAKASGEVRYDWQGGWVYMVEPPQPRWLRRWCSDDFFGNVHAVEFAYLHFGITDTPREIKSLIQTRYLDIAFNGKITDAELKPLEDLPQVQQLFLGGAGVTDAGLEHVKGLAHLQWLWLGDTQITDAGLEHLKGLGNLQVVGLVGTKVTDRGVKKLQQALPNCKIEWMPPTPDERQSPAKPDQPDG